MRNYDVISKNFYKDFLFKEYFDLSYVRNIAMRILIFTFNLNFKIRIFNMFFYIFVLLLM